MTATLEIDESNGAGETVTHGITNSNYGSTDTPDLVDTTYPITAGQNSFEKWHKMHFTALGGASKVKNLKVWASVATGTGWTIKTNARESSYGGAQTYGTGGPSQTDRSGTYGYTQTMPISTPSGANLGIAGALAGELTGVGSSDYLVIQVQTTGAATTGTSGQTNSYQWDEVA